MSAGDRPCPSGDKTLTQFTENEVVWQHEPQAEVSLGPCECWKEDRPWWPLYSRERGLGASQGRVRLPWRRGELVVPLLQGSL